MFEFKKYPSIENSYRKKTIDYIIEQGFASDEWVVLLKAHGANFQLWTNGLIWNPAKRSSFIKESDGNFNNYQMIIDYYRDRLNAATQWLMVRYNCETVTFCGELLGGQYDHPDVKKFTNAIKVQKGVFYCPHNEFYIFDVKVDGMYVSHNVVEKLGMMFNLFVAEPLRRGSFMDCLCYQNMFPDPLYKRFGLPEIEDNFCEGVVIKPVVPKFFGNGSRVILKNKNELFTEKTAKKKLPKKALSMSDDANNMAVDIVKYVTENRLRNVLSHGHTIGQKEFGKLLGLFAKDVWYEFNKDFSDDFNCLEILEQNQIKRILQKECGNTIRPEFQNIIDGEF